MYMMSLAQLWALTLCLHVCQHLTSCLEIFLCVSETSKPNLVYEALMEAKILSSPLPHVFAEFGLVFGTGTLPTGVSTPPKWSNNGPIYLRILQKVFSAWGPNKSWDIELPTPNIFAQLGPALGTGTLPAGVSTPLRQSRNILMCLSNRQTKFCAWGLNGSQDIELPTPHVFANRGLFFVTGTLPADVSTPP